MLSKLRMFDRKEYMRIYYQLNKERCDKRRLICYHEHKEVKTNKGRKRVVDLSVLPPPIAPSTKTSL